MDGGRNSAVATDPSYYTVGTLETCEKIDMVLDALDLNSNDIPARAHGYIFNFLKYFDRMGSKDGEPAEKDAVKCANYIHRALTGEWFDGKSKTSVQ